MKRLLITIDLDNTLLNKTGGIPSSFFPLLRRCKEWTFVIASGRSYQNIVSLFNNQTNGIYIIAENGATIRYNDEVLLDKYLSANQVTDIFSINKNQTENIISYSSSDVELYKPSKELIDYFLLNNVSFKECDNLASETNIKKISFFFKKPIDNIPPTIKTPEGIKCEISTPYLLDFTLGSVSKGKALSLLKSRLDFDIKDCVAFGDSETDLSLFENSSVSFAMQNASDVIKQRASYIAPSNEDEGVVKVLYTLSNHPSEISRYKNNNF